MPARSSTSKAATPISGSLCSVKVSAKSTARTGRARRRCRRRRAESGRRVHAGSVRRRSTPSTASFNARPARLPSHGVGERRHAGCRPRATRAHVAEGAHVERRAVPIPAAPASTSLLMRAMSTLVGHSLLQARHSRHRSSASCTAGVVEPLGAELAAERQAQHVGAPAGGVGLVARGHVGRAHGAARASCGTAPTPLQFSTAPPQAAVGAEVEVA